MYYLVLWANILLCTRTCKKTFNFKFHCLLIHSLFWVLPQNRNCRSFVPGRWLQLEWVEGWKMRSACLLACLLDLVKTMRLLPLVCPSSCVQKVEEAGQRSIQPSVRARETKLNKKVFLLNVWISHPAFLSVLPFEKFNKALCYIRVRCACERERKKKGFGFVTLYNNISLPPAVPMTHSRPARTRTVTAEERRKVRMSLWYIFTFSLSRLMSSFGNFLGYLRQDKRFSILDPNQVAFGRNCK